MPDVHVCPLVARSRTPWRAPGASHFVSLINDDTPVAAAAHHRRDHHLFLGMNDIVEPMEGHVLPAEEHVARAHRFRATAGTAGGRSSSIAIAGISRSTAGAFIAPARVNPQRDESDDRAAPPRRLAASPRPIPLIVALADRLLGRDGRMVEAIAAIGRGEICDASSIPVRDCRSRGAE